MPPEFMQSLVLERLYPFSIWEVFMTYVECQIPMNEGELEITEPIIDENLSIE